MSFHCLREWGLSMPFRIRLWDINQNCIHEFNDAQHYKFDGGTFEIRVSKEPLYVIVLKDWVRADIEEINNG